MGQAMRTTAKAILVSAKKMTCRTKGKGWKDGVPAHQGPASFCSLSGYPSRFSFFLFLMKNAIYIFETESPVSQASFELTT